MSIRTFLFGHKAPQPDAVADALKTAADEHTSAVSRFADIMREMQDEAKRTRSDAERFMAHTADQVPAYSPPQLGRQPK